MPTLLSASENGDTMGSPRNGNFQREHCDFQHGIVIFCRESLIIDDRDSDGDGFFSEL